MTEKTYDFYFTLHNNTSNKFDAIEPLQINGMLRMDNRKHPRFESHAEAKLITADGVNHPCRIADFSQEGLRIYWPEDHDLTLNIADTLYLSLMLEGMPTNVAVLCLFADHNSAGLQLSKPNADLFLKLQQVNQNNRNQGALSNDKRRYYKDLFQQKVRESSQNLIIQWYSHLLEALFTEANRALNNKQQQSLFSAEKKIKDNQQSIQRRFLAHIAEQLIRWLENKPAINTEKNHNNKITTTYRWCSKMTLRIGY